MPRIPFIEARFFGNGESVSDIERRLSEHLVALRRRKAKDQTDPSDAKEDDRDAIRREVAFMPSEDRGRVRRRVDNLCQRRLAASGLQHLRSEDLKRLMPLRNGVELAAIASEHQADELAAELHEAMPWMARATEELWYALRRSAQTGQPGLRVPPLLLDGPAGIGKTYWSERLAKLLRVPALRIDATGDTAGFAIAGVQRGWNSSTPGRPLQSILQTLHGSPVVLVDEIEKAGRATSAGGHSHDLVNALLPLLEPATSARWSCPFFQVKFDMSWIVWILTSNSLAPLTQPFLSRCRVVRLKDLTKSDLIGFARREGAIRGLSEASIEAIVEAIERHDFEKQGLSLRSVLRALERAEVLERRPRLQ